MYYDFNNTVHCQHLKELERNANLREGHDLTQASCSWRTERELEAANARTSCEHVKGPLNNDSNGLLPRTYGFAG